jgi:hypothetical protein
VICLSCGLNRFTDFAPPWVVIVLDLALRVLLTRARVQRRCSSHLPPAVSRAELSLCRQELLSPSAELSARLAVQYSAPGSDFQRRPRDRDNV